MQSSVSPPALASALEAPVPQPPALVVSPTTLLAAFATVPDPRRRQGTRFALPALLTLAVAAILSNHRSVLAIAEWGQSQGHRLLERLGLADGVTPHQSTLQRLFRKLDSDARSAALTAHVAATTPGAAEADRRPRDSQGVAVDGKAQRGRLAVAPGGCPVHARSAFLHDHGVVLAHEPIDPHPQSARAQGGAAAQASTPFAQAEAAWTVAPALIKRLDWHGRVLTGDALCCQRAICQQVVAAGGDDLLIVKENQPTLHRDIQLLFAPPPGMALPLTDRREVTTVDHGHGRHHDTRHLIAATDLVDDSTWPHLAQVFRHERTWQEHGTTKGDVRYGITSLPVAIADADRLLELKRGHWQIENADHSVNDVTMGEDRRLIHLGHGPSILAMFRDLALSLLHHAGYRAIASRLRDNSTHPEAAVALVTTTSTQNA